MNVLNISEYMRVFGGGKALSWPDPTDVPGFDVYFNVCVSDNAFIPLSQLFNGQKPPIATQLINALNGTTHSQMYFDYVALED